VLEASEAVERAPATRFHFPGTPGVVIGVEGDGDGEEYAIMLDRSVALTA